MPKNTKSDEVIKAIPAGDVEILPPGEDVDKPQKNISIESIIEYASKGLTLSEVAKLCNCSKQNVQQRLRAVAFDKTDLENFKNHRKDVFAFIQAKLLNSLDEETIKGMNPYQRVISAGVLYDKERLERGQSTENINIVELNLDLEHLRKRKAELLKLLNNNQGNIEETKTHEKR